MTTFYTVTSNPAPSSQGRSSAIRDEFVLIQTALASVDTAINLKAPAASPTFTGTPIAPTAAPGTNTTQVATTAYADLAVGVETARATAAEALKAPLASPTFTGPVTVPTPSSATDAATKGYVDGVAMSAALPGQTGNAGKFVGTDGTTASWQVPSAIAIFNQINFGGF